MDPTLAIWLGIVCCIVIGVVLCWMVIRKSELLGDAYHWTERWNQHIAEETQRQNQISDPDLPTSMQRALTCNLPAARKLERLLRKHHDQVMIEINTLIDRGYTGMPMGELDSVQGRTFRNRGGRQWRPIWVKFIDTWAGTAEYLPTLRRIVERMSDDILLLHVSVFWGQVDLPPHQGVSKGVYRYHYGLEIPEGDTGMLIDNTPFRWLTGEGYIWDDTLTHSSWNRTNARRMVIFADLPRHFDGMWRRFLNRRVHSFLQQTKHIHTIQERLSREGKRID